MLKPYLPFITATSIIVGALFMVGTTNKQKINDGKITVVCTTTMIADAIKNIGGDLVHIECLMGPGIDPHIYRAKESDVHRLANADIIFYNGLHLEGKMSSMLHNMQSRTKTVAMADALNKNSLLATDDNSAVYDPHIWFNVNLWMQTVKQVAQVLQKFDPEYADIYKENAQQYLEQLTDLDNYIHSTVAQLNKEQRILITAHDAFGYFGNAYGFKVIGLQGVSTDSEPSTKDIQQLANYIVDNKVRAIFIETSIPERTIKAVQHAAQARGWSVEIGPELFSDALGEPDGEQGSYIGMVKYNIDTIVGSLNNLKNFPL